MGGSLGELHAKKIWLVMEMAIKTGSTNIGLIDSGGGTIYHLLCFLRNMNGPTVSTHDSDNRKSWKYCHGALLQKHLVCSI
jgi:hypothetical protein